jgi:hypothetical protein
LKKKKSLHKTIIAFVFSLVLMTGLLAVANQTNPIVYFPDQQLETLVREMLDRPSGPIYKIDLLRTFEIDASGRGIENIEGLQHFSNLSVLNLEGNTLSNISALSELSKLVDLNLSDNYVFDLTPLSSLNSMRELDLSKNQIEDLWPLNNLHALEKLNLRENRFTNIEPLSSLTQLTYLNLHSNTKIDSIRPIANLIRLETLILQNVPVEKDIDALQFMTALKRLDLRNCGIIDTQILGGLMATGALQDDTESGLSAEVNLLENVLQSNEQDGAASLRPYWRNISYRYPQSLPYTKFLADPPVFSRPGGFYPSGFSLSITSNDPGATIYYSLNGEEPTIKSQQYTSPILLNHRAEDPNIYSAIPTSSDWQGPSDEVFKGTVVRAVAVADDGKQSNIATQTYFIHPLANERYTFPVISITTDPDYLFDPEIGIYTDHNSRESGKKWERPAHIEFYEPNGSLGFEQNIGIRIHGGTPRLYSEKSLRLYARAEYDEKDIFSYEIFPGLKKSGSGEPLTEFKTLILRNSGNDNSSTMFRDVFMQSLVDHLDSIETQAYRPAMVFVNGEYWGIHNVRERYDAHYVHNHFDAEEEAVTILINDAMLWDGAPEDREDYLELREFIAETDLSIEENYRYIESRMDVQNFIETFVANIFFGNRDWPQHNIRYWRISQGNPDIRGQDGRWRWMLQDTDFGFSRFDETDEGYLYWMFEGNDGASPDDFQEKYGAISGPEINMLLWATSTEHHRFNAEWPNLIFRSLLENEAFKNRFINSMADHLNSTFHPDRVITQLGAMQSLYEPEIEEHISRWQAIDSLEGWYRNINVMRDFALKRPNAVRSHIVDYFGLSGTMRVTIKTDTTKGRIRINNLDVQATTPGISDPDDWTGIYFRGVPVQVFAVPEPGFIFAGWADPGLNGSAMENCSQPRCNTDPNLYRKVNRPLRNLNQLASSNPITGITGT